MFCVYGLACTEARAAKPLFIMRSTTIKAAFALLFLLTTISALSPAAEKMFPLSSGKKQDNTKNTLKEKRSFGNWYTSVYGADMYGDGGAGNRNSNDNNNNNNNGQKNCADMCNFCADDSSATYDCNCDDSDNDDEEQCACQTNDMQYP
eukprot:g745.t1